MLGRVTASLSRKLVGRDDFTDQFRRYRRTFLWVLASLYRSNPRKFALTVVASVTGVMLQAGALSFLLYYGSLMERDAGLDLLGQYYPARDQQVFIAIIAFAGLVLITSSWFKFFAARSNPEICIEFATECGKRILQKPWLILDGRQQAGTDLFPEKMTGLVTGIKPLSRGAKPIMSLSSPLTTMLYSLAFLIYLEPLLTLIIFTVLAPSFVLQYLISYHTTQNEKVFKATGRSSRGQIEELIRSVARRDPREPEFRQHLDDSFSRGPIANQLHAFLFRMIAPGKSALVSDILMALLALGAMSYLGSMALAGEKSWITFLAYLLFARINLNAIRGIFSTVTNFARHYRKVRSVFLAINGEFDGKAPATPSPGRLQFKANGGPKKWQAQSRTIRTDRLLPLLCPTPLTRFNLGFFCHSLGVESTNTNRLLYHSALVDCAAFAHGEVDPTYHSRDSQFRKPGESLGSGEITGPSYQFHFLDAACLDLHGLQKIELRIDSEREQNKFWFLCGQSIAVFDSIQDQRTVLILRPDGKLMMSEMNELRAGRRAITRWLRNGLAPGRPETEDDDD